MKHFTQILVIALMALFLTGMVFAGGEKEGAAEEGAAMKDVTVSFWHFPQIGQVDGYAQYSKEYGDWWKYLAGKFNDQNDGITVETQLVPWDGGFEKFNVAIAGGEPPTVGLDYLGRTAQYYASGAATAASDVLPASLINDINDSIRQIYTVDGKVHALPGFAWNINLNVNVGLLEKHGWSGPILNGPGNAYSDEEFTAFLTKVKNTVPSDVWPFVIQCGNEQGDYGWWQFFWGFGGKLFDENGNVYDDPSGVIEGYKYIMELRDKGLTARGIASMQATDPNKFFFSGKAAVGYGHKYHAKQIEQAIEEGVIDAEYNVMPVPYPSDSGDKGFTANGGTGFIFLGQEEAELEGGSKWVQFVMSDEWWPKTVKGGGQFPLQKSMAGADLYAGDEYQAVVSEMLGKFESGDFGLAHPKYQQIRVALSQCGQKIFAGRDTVENAVEDFYAEVRKIVGE